MTEEAVKDRARRVLEEVLGDHNILMRDKIDLLADLFAVVSGSGKNRNTNGIPNAYNIGQEVWFMHGGQMHRDKVAIIDCYTYKDLTPLYSMENSYMDDKWTEHQFKESEIFPSEEALRVAINDNDR